MPEAMSYWNSRKTQENKNLLKKIDESLKNDWKIDNTEAKEIQDKYKKLKSNILAITKEELASFANWLWLESSATLWQTINKLKEKSNNTGTPPANTPSSPIQEAGKRPPVTKTGPQQETTSETIKNELISKYSSEYQNLQTDIINFLNKSFSNWLQNWLWKFNISEFDNKDNKEWFSEYELEEFKTVLDKAINQMKLLWWYDNFKKQNKDKYHDMPYFIWTKDVFIANKIEETQTDIFWKWDIDIINNLHNYSEEKLSKMREEEFDLTDWNKMKDLWVLLWIELWDWVQDILKFLVNIPMWVILLPRYISNRNSLSDWKVDTEIEAKIQIEQDTLLKENPSLMLWELIWDKWLQMIKQLWEMFISWKNWDIAMLLVTIAGLIAWWAGAVKFLAKAGKMGKTAKIAWKIQNKANKIDDIVWWAGIWHMTWAFSWPWNKLKQTAIAKKEQLPALKAENLPVEFKKIEWVSDIRNPELIAEFKSGIYDPISEIKNSSKIIEAEVIESKIVENISKLDKILLNIEKLKSSFASKWEKISELFSKTLLEAKNYILWLKKSLKLKKIERFKLPGWEKLKEWAIFSHSWYNFRVVRVWENWKVTISSISKKENWVVAIFDIKVDNFNEDMIRWIEKNRYVKIYGEKSDITQKEHLKKKPKKIDKSKELLRNFDNLPKSPHAQELLEKYPELKPVDTLEIDWKTFYFSKVQVKWDYEEVVWFIEVTKKDINWNNIKKLESKYFYKSNSDGWWRASPGERTYGGYSKATEHENGIKWASYTVTTKVSIEIWKKLNSIKKVKSEKNISTHFLDIRTQKEYENYLKYEKEFLEIKQKLIKKAKKAKTQEEADEIISEIENEQDRLIEKYDIPDRFWINTESFVKETHLFDDSEIDEMKGLRKKWNPWNFIKEFKWEDITSIKKYFRDLKYPDKFIPNFGRWPIRTYYDNHTIAWKTKVDIFEWELNWQKVEWHMAQNLSNPDQVWISNIRLKWTKVNSNWIDETFINSWILNNKPFEYKSQLPSSLQKWKLIKEKYIDLTPVLAELKPIREYKRYLASLDEGKKVVNW